MAWRRLRASVRGFQVRSLPVLRKVTNPTIRFPPARRAARAVSGQVGPRVRAVTGRLRTSRAPSRGRFLLESRGLQRTFQEKGNDAADAYVPHAVDRGSQRPGRRRAPRLRRLDRSSVSAGRARQAIVLLEPGPASRPQQGRSAATAAAPVVSRFRLTMPHLDTELLFDDQKITTTGVGVNREWETPPLERGRTYRVHLHRQVAAEQLHARHPQENRSVQRRRPGRRRRSVPGRPGRPRRDPVRAHAGSHRRRDDQSWPASHATMWSTSRGAATPESPSRRSRRAPGVGLESTWTWRSRGRFAEAGERGGTRRPDRDSSG